MRSLWIAGCYHQFNYLSLCMTLILERHWRKMLLNLKILFSVRIVFYQLKAFWGKMLQNMTFFKTDVMTSF